MAPRSAVIPALALALAATATLAQDAPPHPDPADASHATPATAELFASFFAAKTGQDVAGTMAFVSPALATYTDATLGWDLASFDALEGTFVAYMPTWGEGASYPTRILGDVGDGDGSALVAFTDTPELFGDEIRALGVVDVRDGLVVRWVDYWDSSGFSDEVYDAMRTPADAFPTDLREDAVGQAASPEIVAASEALQAALASGDAAAAAALLSPDSVWEDMSARTQVLGRAAIERYLGRALPVAPFGEGAGLRHVVGGEMGGGFEWVGAPDGPVPHGVTALELDGAGLITRATTVYDGRLLAADARAGLAAAALEP